MISLSQVKGNEGRSDRFLKDMDIHKMDSILLLDFARQSYLKRSILVRIESHLG